MLRLRVFRTSFAGFLCDSEHCTDANPQLAGNLLPAMPLSAQLTDCFVLPTCPSYTSPPRALLSSSNSSSESSHSDSSVHREGIVDSATRAALYLDIHSQPALACPPMSWASPMPAPDSSAILGLRADVVRQSNRARVKHGPGWTATRARPRLAVSALLIDV